MESILTDGHYFLPYTSKRCIIFKHFDGLAGKHQKCQNFCRQNFALYGMLVQSSYIIAVWKLMIVLSDFKALII